MVKEGSSACVKLLSCVEFVAPSFVRGLNVSFKRMPSGVLDEPGALFAPGLPVLTALAALVGEFELASAVLVAVLMSSALERGLLHAFRR